MPAPDPNMLLLRASDLEPWYWVRMPLKTAHGYLRRRKYIACVRAVFRATVLHDNGETCRECGRGGDHTYLLWMASDAIYRRVHGTSGGLYCPACFSAKAKKEQDLLLVWAPHIWRDGAHLNDIAAEIGAFQ